MLSQRYIHAMSSTIINKTEETPFRVLHIMSGYGGGISSFIYNKAVEMKKHNVIFDVVTYDDVSDTFRRAIENLDGKIYKMQNPKTKGWKAFENSFGKLVKEKTYDVIHCHIDGYRALAYAYFVKRYHKGPFYIHAHLAHKPETFNDITKLHLNQRINRTLSDAYVGCGTDAIRSIYGHIPMRKVIIIPNSIDVDQFIDEQPDPDFRQELNEKYDLHLDEKTLIVAQIARLEKVKNHDWTIKLAEQVKQEGLNMVFLIVGSGNREEELKQKVKDLGLEKIVIFLGRIEPISKFYPNPDAYILPSHIEGFPTAGVEIQSVGKPAIFSNTITSEVDLGLGLFSFLSIKEGDECYWIEQLKTIKEIDLPTREECYEKLEQKNFTNPSAAALYNEFLRGRLSQNLL